MSQDKRNDTRAGSRDTSQSSSKTGSQAPPGGRKTAAGGQDKSAGKTANAAQKTPATTSGSPSRGAQSAVRPRQTSGRGGGNAGASRGAGGASGGGRAASAIAVVAVLIALVALATAGWAWYRGAQGRASTEQRVATLEHSQQTNIQKVVMPKLSKFEQRLSSLAAKTRQQGDTLGSIQAKLDAAQSRMAQLARQTDRSGDSWRLQRIESLLQAANQRLLLYRDPAGAMQALHLADRAIQRMADPRLHDIRQRVAREIAALQALPAPDIEGLSLALAAMAEQVSKLPLASDVASRYQPESRDKSAGAGDTLDFSEGWRQFFDSVGDALSGMFTIRQSDGTQRALMPPDQVFFLNQNLELQLRTARLALLERHAKNYRQSLGNARQWLRDYYAQDNTAVSNMRQRLAEMRNVELDWQAPDLSASLRALRQIIKDRARGETSAGSPAGQGTSRGASAAGANGSSSNAASPRDAS